MKALVVGASGQVGRALVFLLKKRGWEVVGTYYPPVDRMPFLDVRDAGAVWKCLVEVRPDVVFLAVNNAGGVDYCETHPEEAYTLHVDGTINVARSVVRLGARIIYYSSDYVFDGQSGPYLEEDEAFPINTYGKAKLEAEERIQELTSNYLILRTTVVYGWDRTSKNFATQVWEQLSAGKSMRVPNDQWGNPTLAGYLAEISINLVNVGAVGIFNVVGKDRMPRSAFAQALAHTMAFNSNLIIPVPTYQLG